MKYIINRSLSIVIIAILFLCVAQTIPFSGEALSQAFAESDLKIETQISAMPAETVTPQSLPFPTVEPHVVVEAEKFSDAEMEIIESESKSETTDRLEVSDSEGIGESILWVWIQTTVDFISDLSIEHITLLSVLVTLIIFVSGKQSEAKYKKLEARREEYTKFINLLQKTFSGKIKQDDVTKKEFFDAGVSLLLYGSKKVYKKYLFFREFTSNPLIVQSKYNEPEISIYIIADLLKTIRHEVGMTSFSELSTNEALAFFVNDIGMNPVSKIQSYRARYSIFMIKAELVAIDCTKLVFVKKIYYCVVKPVFGIIHLILKYVLLIPMGRILAKLFPKWAAQVTKEKNDPHS